MFTHSVRRSCRNIALHLAVVDQEPWNFVQVANKTWILCYSRGECEFRIPLFVYLLSCWRRRRIIFKQQAFISRGDPFRSSPLFPSAVCLGSVVWWVKKAKEPREFLYLVLYKFNIWRYWNSESNMSFWQKKRRSLLLLYERSL